jgi:hypothetical protein
MDYRDVATAEGSWYESLDTRRMVATVWIGVDDYEDLFAVPVRFEVCETCDGKGTYVNPSVDSHGISAEEWNDWDDDEREMYHRGDYDVVCATCGGKRVEPVPDYDHMEPSLANRLRETIKARHDSAIEFVHEREMGY